MRFNKRTKNVKKFVICSVPLQNLSIILIFYHDTIKDINRGVYKKKLNESHRSVNVSILHLFLLCVFEMQYELSLPGLSPGQAPAHLGLSISTLLSSSSEVVLILDAESL